MTDGAQSKLGIAGAPVPDPDAPGPVALRRLRWHARRGLLENDLVLNRFFDRYAAQLPAHSLEALAALLVLPDGELLDLVLDRQAVSGELDRAPVREVLALLRAV
jgi:antitoxin CptB